MFYRSLSLATRLIYSLAVLFYLKAAPSLARSEGMEGRRNKKIFFIPFILVLCHKVASLYGRDKVVHIKPYNLIYNKAELKISPLENVSRNDLFFFFLGNN